METVDNQVNLTLFFVILIFCQIFGLFYLSVLHKVRGAVYRGEAKSARALFFRTKYGDHRVDGQHKQWNFKEKGKNTWDTIKFEEILGIYQLQDVENASVFEFFLGGFSIWDFSGKYRDHMRNHHIRLRLKGGGDVPLMTLKQYQQREWFLAQFIHDFQLLILSKIGWYRDIDDVSEEWMDTFVEKLEPYGLALTIQC